MSRYLLLKTNAGKNASILRRTKPARTHGNAPDTRGQKRHPPKLAAAKAPGEVGDVDAPSEVFGKKERGDKAVVDAGHGLPQ